MDFDNEPTIMMDQGKLKTFLLKRLERLDASIGDKLVLEKQDAIQMKELEKDMIVVQDNLIRVHAKLKEREKDKTHHETGRQQAHEELDVAKTMHAMMTDKLKKEKAYVSHMETKVDRLWQNLFYTQSLNEDLLAKGKTLKNFKTKAGADKIQAEADKLKQVDKLKNQRAFTLELFVSRLTRDLEKVAEQAAMYKVHAAAQERQKQELQQVLAETESVKGSLVMEYNQLFQQWNHSLMALKKQDAAFNDIQEALRNATDQATTLNIEVEGYKKAIKVEKEKYKTLLEKLERSRLDNTVSETLMEEALAKQADLQHQYSTCLQILQDTENTYNRLKKQSKALEDEVLSRRRQVERESAERLELEGKIISLMQQKLILQKSSKQPYNNLGPVKKEKISLLWQLETELKSLGQECSETVQHIDGLKRSQDALDQDIIKNDKLLEANQGTINALLLNIRQHHARIDLNNRRILEIREKTGREVLNPLQIQVDTLTQESEELAEINTEKRQLWERQQGVLVQLAQQKKASTTIFLDLQTKYCVLNQRKIRVESHIEVENREKAELMRYIKTLMEDRLKLNTLMHKNTRLRQALELENALKETNNLYKLKAGLTSH
ncbi:coiled-coil domain-containing protein 40-like [Genypterus blacodes]|uniref:coiled-coil domain-containing protein 40-like n=1 Tax=Genypterus blacodes TaxID=154954 RepID=UPI003F76BCC7